MYVHACPYRWCHPYMEQYHNHNRGCKHYHARLALISTWTWTPRWNPPSRCVFVCFKYTLTTCNCKTTEMWQHGIYCRINHCNFSVTAPGGGSLKIQTGFNFAQLYSTIKLYLYLVVCSVISTSSASLPLSAAVKHETFLFVFFFLFCPFCFGPCDTATYCPCSHKEMLADTSANIYAWHVYTFTEGSQTNKPARIVLEGEKKKQ